MYLIKCKLTLHIVTNLLNNWTKPVELGGILLTFNMAIIHVDNIASNDKKVVLTDFEFV